MPTGLKIAILMSLPCLGFGQGQPAASRATPRPNGRGLYGYISYVPIVTRQVAKEL